MVIFSKYDWHELGQGNEVDIASLSVIKNSTPPELFFYILLQKNERSNITKNEHDVLKMVAEKFVTATDAMVTDLIDNGEIWEVHQQ